MLADTAHALGGDGTRVGTVVADLASAADRLRLVACASTWNGGIDVLINNAGVSHFGLYGDAAPESIEQTLAVNLLAPMLLVHALLPTLAKCPQAAIVNIGSVFGAIGYPGNATYSATKFGLRGFSEALRRELTGGTVRVLHVAPRTTRTTINSRAVDSLNDELGVAADAPETVAAWIRKRIELELADGDPRLAGAPVRETERVAAAPRRWRAAQATARGPALRGRGRQQLRPHRATDRRPVSHTRP